jgi:hypothetical protein
MYAVADACVRALDRFRWAPSAAGLARRRQGGLLARQDAPLMQAGYPCVLHGFRFHMALSGRMPKHDQPVWRKTVAQHRPDLPAPFVIDQIALWSEREDGRFEPMHRYASAG